LFGEFVLFGDICAIGELSLLGVVVFPLLFKKKKKKQ